MLPLHSLLLVVSTHFSLATFAAAKDSRGKEICPKVCEPEKCPNVGPIGLSQCPVQYIVTYRCGCCKKCDVAHLTTTLPPSRRDEVCEKMTCPKKKVCVMNVQGLPVCKCPTEDICKKLMSRGDRKKTKVCGSNGVTYASRCHLKVASCGSEGKIRVAKKGECSSLAPSLKPPTTPLMITANRKYHIGKSKKGSRKQHSQSRIRGNNRKQARRNDKKQNRRQGRKRERNYQRAPKLERQRRG